MAEREGEGQGERKTGRVSRRWWTAPTVAAAALLAPAAAAAEPVTEQAMASARMLTQDEVICAAPTLMFESKAYIDMMVRLFNATPTLAALERSYPGLALEASRITQRTGIELIKARGPDLCRAITQTLAESLPESNLAVLAAFQASPLGRKLFGGALQIYLVSAPEWFANPEALGFARSMNLAQLLTLQTQFSQKAVTEAFASLSPDEQAAFQQFLASSEAQAMKRVAPGNMQRNADLSMRFMADFAADAERLATPRIRAALDRRIAAKRKR